MDEGSFMDQMFCEDVYYETIQPVDVDDQARTSSASLPSHNTRWTSEEDELLRSALDTYGYGNWKVIAEFVKTRNPLQCKNHARHWLATSKIDPTTLQPGVKTEPNSPTQRTIGLSDTQPASFVEFIATPTNDVGGVMMGDLQATVLMMETNEEPVITNEAPTKIRTQTKTAEKVFDRDNVSAEEKKRNPEWFCDKPAKTPERYMKIRNYILDCWENCQPEYLTKTCARRGLRNCGDVNAIGRVHTYLENVGAINVDCVAPSTPRPTRRAPRKVYDYVSASDEESMDGFVSGHSNGSRKRKIHKELGYWGFPAQVVQSSDGSSRPKRVIKRPQHYYDHDGSTNEGYDPFRLVPLAYYNDEYPAPFVVEIQSDALLIFKLQLVMDFHAHLAYTEIIGLLGGTFVEINHVKTLIVQCVFPCRSISTGIQCEMDPASEMKAREIFAQKGYTVVGWYHSHPTFEPHPSVRDIENQTLYQTLFRDECTGDEPFIGVIVTPYDPEIVNDNQSKVQYLHISNRWNTTQSYRLPYACRRKIRHNESQVSPEVMERFKELVEEFKDYEHKIDMRLQFGIQTRLEKLLDSLQSHLYLCDDEAEKFLDSVRDLVMNVFVDADENAPGRMVNGMVSSNVIDGIV
ncbi:Myb-like, SWIRM and MPN domains 1 [Apophysomyces sp. BC1034]|nr:Myb-like, SWIRM and MPN domains 1 [Apophysomyces sp. BC1015]KAG0178589.1 Myb-like, SWIRM and MPN domains 1 [Apophysomyces sp. BC1021]KAG0190141.1 Myb-like, SWIRM and MPN domains 1 [Apophysomyces sp. BC1034]